MTNEQLENSISRMQISEVERYNELKKLIQDLALRLEFTSHIDLVTELQNNFSRFTETEIDKCSHLNERVKILEEARSRQIVFNTSVTNDLKRMEVKPESEKKSLWDFFK